MAVSEYHKAALKTSLLSAAAVLLVGVVLSLLGYTTVKNYEQEIVRYELLEQGNTTLSEFNSKLRTLVENLDPIASQLVNVIPHKPPINTQLDAMADLNGITSIHSWVDGKPATHGKTLSAPSIPQVNLWSGLSSSVAGVAINATPVSGGSVGQSLRLDYFAYTAQDAQPVLSVVVDLQRYLATEGLELAQRGVDVKLVDMVGGQATLLAHYPVDMPMMEDGIAVLSETQIAGHRWQLSLLPSDTLVSVAVGRGARSVLATLMVVTMLAAYFFGALAYRRKEAECRLAASEVRWKAKQASIEGLSVIDSVTGLYNRNHFEVMLDSECRRAVRDFTPLTLVCIQIGGFDSYLQAHGSSAANRCLKSVAVSLRKAVSRPGDLIALYDAGRFMLLLPSTNEKVGALAERCLKDVRETALALDDTRPMSVAIGVATMQPSTALNSENAIKHVDIALREAQSRGGDKFVALASDESPTELSYTI